MFPDMHDEYWIHKKHGRLIPFLQLVYISFKNTYLKDGASIPAFFLTISHLLSPHWIRTKDAKFSTSSPYILKQIDEKLMQCKDPCCSKG
jgi:hypothetical protein